LKIENSKIAKPKSPNLPNFPKEDEKPEVQGIARAALCLRQNAGKVLRLAESQYRP
jgi:hypothetical protein